MTVVVAAVVVAEAESVVAARVPHGINSHLCSSCSAYDCGCC